jgi:NitT/TauT family transport system permease protein
MQPTASSPPLVALRGIGKAFANGTRALAGFDLDVREGEFVALLGPSGCGKSTALRIVAGLSEPSAGIVDWAPDKPTAPPNRNRIGFVFQEPTLMPWENVFCNVLLPLSLKRLPTAISYRKVISALDNVGLANAAYNYPRELSGGMRMRASIARALVTEPQLLLMDEPFAALDEITRFKLNDDLLAMWQALRTTVVFVTHSVFESVYLANRVVVMAARPGRVFTEVAIDAPYPRDNFRTSAAYADLCGEGALRILLPIIVLALVLAAWEATVSLAGVPPYVLPAPSLILKTLVDDWPLLSHSLAVTLTTTLEGFLLAAVGGIALAILFNLSRLVEFSFYPYAVILQVTPIIAIAPLLLVYLPQQVAVLACAWIVAFFPVLANTTLGLNSVDRNLADLFRLNGASPDQVLLRLKLPSAMPYILGGLRIAGGLSLIGAVVAEIAAGSAGAASGLAFRIVESGYRLNIPRMFAALLLLSIAGIVIFYVLALVNYLFLRRWHESALDAER